MEIIEKTELNRAVADFELCFSRTTKNPSKNELIVAKFYYN